MKIGLLLPGPADATSWYRGALPWMELGKQRRHNVEIITEVKPWCDLAAYDVIVSQRPMIPIHQEVVVRAVKLNIPVIVDFDDDQLNLPPWNGMYQTFERPECKQTAITCAQLATAVIVSTPTLANVWGQYSKKIEVIPNAWPDRAMPWVPLKERSPLLMWRTTNSQRGDHHLFPEALNPTAIEFPELRYMSIGEPAFFEDYIPSDRMTKYPWLETLEYFNLLRQVYPTVCAKPMQEHRFNHAKSNIAWMEAVFSGAVMVAPDWKEWKVPGCINYGANKSFRNALAEALDLDEAERLKLVKEARAFIDKNLLLSKVNAKRQAILEKL